MKYRNMAEKLQSDQDERKTNQKPVQFGLRTRVLIT